MRLSSSPYSGHSPQPLRNCISTTADLVMLLFLPLADLFLQIITRCGRNKTRLLAITNDAGALLAAAVALVVPDGGAIPLSTCVIPGRNYG